MRNSHEATGSTAGTRVSRIRAWHARRHHDGHARTVASAVMAFTMTASAAISPTTASASTGIAAMLGANAGSTTSSLYPKAQETGLFDSTSSSANAQPDEDAIPGDDDLTGAERVRIQFVADKPGDATGDVLGTMDDMTVILDGSEAELPKSTLRLRGYDFDGWVTDELTQQTQGDGIATTPALRVPDGQRMVGLDWDEEVVTKKVGSDGQEHEERTVVPHSLAGYVIDGKVSLHAQWRKRATEAEAQDMTAQETETGNQPEGLPQARSDTQGDDGDEDSDGSGSAADAETDETLDGDDISYVKSKDLEAALIEGDAAASEADVTSLVQEKYEVPASTATRVSKAMLAAPVLRAEGDGDEPDVSGRSGDGTNIESVSIRWITADTTDDGDAANLYLHPTDDTDQVMRLRLSYALSGEHDYNPGDINIVLPASIWTYRDGTHAGKLEIPYPEDPKTSQDFNWKQVGDTYVITNTRRMSAATKGFIDLEVSEVTPHKVIDHATSSDFTATIQVLTHCENLLSLASNALHAQIDTRASIRSATKGAQSYRWVTPDQIPADQRIEGEEEYLVIVWRFYAYTQANTEFSVSVTDNVPNEYGAFILGTGGLEWTGENVYTGYATGSTTVNTIQVAYPASQIPHDTLTEFHNQVTYQLTETDPRIEGDDWVDEREVTTTTASAAKTLVNKTPGFIPPTGNFWLYKRGDGGYTKALFDIREGQPVEFSYTTESIGRLFPWTLRDGGDPKVLSDYGQKAVTMTTTDTDDQQNEGHLWLSTGEMLTLGEDYDYVAVEFPERPITKHATPTNMNADGTPITSHSEDGYFDYEDDTTTANSPIILLEALVNNE